MWALVQGYYRGHQGCSHVHAHIGWVVGVSGTCLPPEGRGPNRGPWHKPMGPPPNNNRAKQLACAPVGPRVGQGTGKPGSTGPGEVGVGLATPPSTTAAPTTSKAPRPVHLGQVALLTPRVCWTPQQSRPGEGPMGKNKLRAQGGPLIACGTLNGW